MRQTTIRYDNYDCVPLDTEIDVKMTVRELVALRLACQHCWPDEKQMVMADPRIESITEDMMHKPCFYLPFDLDGMCGECGWMPEDWYDE